MLHKHDPVALSVMTFKTKASMMDALIVDGRPSQTTNTWQGSYDFTMDEIENSH
jgi:hypothetical protein